MKFSVYPYLENKQGFERLPGFRATSPKAMTPRVITNEGQAGRRLKQPREREARALRTADQTRSLPDFAHDRDQRRDRRGAMGIS